MQFINPLIRSSLLILLLVSSSTWAKLSQSIDRDEITAGETFVLDIQIDRNLDVQPDLSLIPADFTIVATNQYQHTQILNGLRETKKGWKIKLKTLQAGPIEIPSITVGDESTQPIKLNIRDSSNQLDLDGNTKAIYLEANIDRTHAYVQQQVVYTVSLYRAVNTHYASLSEPNAENSIIEKLGDDIQFEKTIDSRRYIVTQRKYAIFPQQSGELEISPVNFTADVNDNRQKRSMFLNSTRPISISTQSIKLKVDPKPASAGEFWLPAKRVVFGDQWSPNDLQLTVGEPATWTLILSVQGLSESQLPAIEIPSVDGIQVYPDAPQKERQITKDGILGQRVEKLAVIPTKAGEIKIPSITIKWWDVEADEEKIAVLPAKTLIVKPGDATKLNVTPAPPEILKIDNPAGVTGNSLSNPWWPYISGLFALLWLITLFAYQRKSAKATGRPSKTRSSQQSSQSASHKQAYKRAANALKNKNTAELIHAIIQIAQSLNNPQVHTLGAVIKLLSDEGLIKKLRSLEAEVYSASQQSQSFELSTTDLNALINQLSQQRDNQVSRSIPPLYPQ